MNSLSGNSKRGERTDALLKKALNELSNNSSNKSSIGSSTTPMRNMKKGVGVGVEVGVNGTMNEVQEMFFILRSAKIPRLLKFSLFCCGALGGILLADAVGRFHNSSGRVQRSSVGRLQGVSGGASEK